MCLKGISFFLITDCTVILLTAVFILLSVCVLANARCECNVGWGSLQAAAVHWHLHCRGNGQRAHYTNHKRCCCQGNKGNCCLCKGGSEMCSRLRNGAAVWFSAAENVAWPRYTSVITKAVQLKRFQHYLHFKILINFATPFFINNNIVLFSWTVARLLEK